jgi:hypothetical protein
LRTAFALLSVLAISCVEANALSETDLQTLARSTEPVAARPPTALGAGYNSFSQKELPTCFNPPTRQAVTDKMGVLHELFYAQSREDLLRQLRAGIAAPFAPGPDRAIAALTNRRLAPYHRFLAARVTVRGRGTRFVHHQGWIDDALRSAATAPFFARCGDKFAREVYPTASLTVLFALNLGGEDEAAAMDGRAEDQTGSADDGARLTERIGAIRDKADWIAEADTVGWNRTVPSGDRLLPFIANFADIVDHCRTEPGGVVCSTGLSIVDAARSSDGTIPEGAFLTETSAMYDDYRNEIGMLDVSRRSTVARDISDHYVRLLDLRDAGSPFFLNAQLNYWPRDAAQERSHFESQVAEALASLGTAAGRCAARLDDCADIDFAVADRTMEDNPFGERYGAVAVSDVDASRENQALGYIAAGRIGLVDFVGSIMAPAGSPYRDARATDLVELRLRNATGKIDDANPIRFTGQTCVKGPATVIYSPLGPTHKYYAGRNFRGRIWIVDAREEANLPAGTTCHSPPP